MKDLITKFQSYKWYLFTPFAILILWGAILSAIGKSPKVPALIFSGLFILWCVVWIIATVIYRRGLK